MSTDLAKTQDRPALPEAVEAAVIGGDLSKLTIPQRIEFYRARCEAAGLDPRARPFQYINLQGKLVLYATKECSEQLNGKHGLSHEIIGTEVSQGLYEVRVRVTGKSGRSSEDIGVVVTDGLRGADLANSRMKCVTKAKRRATLSFCGLGDVIDESELDTVQVRRCDENGKALPYANQSDHGKGQYASDEQTGIFLEKSEGYQAKRNAQWLDRWTQKDGSIPAGIKRDLINRWQADKHLLKWCCETGRLDPSINHEGLQNRNIGRFTAIVYHRSREDRIAIADELARYIDEQEQRAIEALQRTNPELFPETGEKTEDEILDDIAGQNPEGKGDAWEGPNA